MQIFAPGPDTTRSFRDALGRFATGVAVVTTQGPDGPVGITANSFASVSLEPPLVLWSPARASRRFAIFVTAPRYAIHILRDDQEDLGRAFTRSWTGPEGLQWQVGREGLPHLPVALARFDCRLHTVHEGGDHAIVVGQVVEARFGEGRPLVFHAGAYGRLAG
jgi:flavin reductase (DIM6/NTAB) family NADH-FMN oxidoreductase RutF